MLRERGWPVKVSFPKAHAGCAGTPGTASGSPEPVIAHLINVQRGDVGLATAQFEPSRLPRAFGNGAGGGSSLELTPDYDICPQVRSGGEAVQAMAIGRNGSVRSSGAATPRPRTSSRPMRLARSSNTNST